MPTPSREFSFPLFVPADRPELFEKALAAGSDCIVVDLEDAVAPANKIFARNSLLKAFSQDDKIARSVVVRINGAHTSWYQEDLAAVERCRPAGIMVPKVDTRECLRPIVNAMGPEMSIIALIESAAGVASAREIAPQAHQLAFGSIDFAADIGCSLSREALLHARSEIVIASRIAGLHQPIDGVTTAIRDDAVVEDDARYARSLGFGGKLLIHPAQVAPAQRGMAPTLDEIMWARRVLNATSSSTAIAVDGSMVDAPVVARAQKIIERQNISTAGAEP